MTKEEMKSKVVAKHEAEIGFCYDPDIIDRVLDEGLVDGDNVHLGGTLKATISGFHVNFDNGTKVQTVPFSSLTGAQKDAMLINKAYALSKKGHSTGSPFC